MPFWNLLTIRLRVRYSKDVKAFSNSSSDPASSMPNQEWRGQLPSSVINTQDSMCQDQLNRQGAADLRTCELFAMQIDARVDPACCNQDTTFPRGDVNQAAGLRTGGLSQPADLSRFTNANIVGWLSFLFSFLLRVLCKHRVSIVA
jgi:hypothetical protein